MVKISIIIPIYNTEKYLHRCIDSILVQTFSDFELILVDDGSTDNSGKICDEYANRDNRIVVFHQKNQGQSKARNVALDYVFKQNECEWIGFIDSDDWVHPKYLEVLLSSAEMYNLKISNVFLSHVTTRDSITSDIDISIKVSVEDMEDVYVSFGKEVACYPQGRLYHSTLWKDIRFPEGKIWEDVATLYKIFLQVSKVVLVDGDLYYYFINPEGTTGGKWNPRYFEEIEAYEKQLRNKRIRNNPIISPCLREQFIARLLSQLKEVRMSDITEKEKKTYEKRIVLKLKYYLYKYSKGTKYDFNKEKYYYEMIYPREMKCYWYWQALKRKLKRK